VGKEKRGNRLINASLEGISYETELARQFQSSDVSANLFKLLL